MIEATHWHPVARVDDLGDAPLAATLLGEALVLWRDATGAVHAWSDRCPHRGARLSMGRVLREADAAGGARLECPYHGWRFAAGGRCERIPALPGFEPPSGHRATAREVRVREQRDKLFATVAGHRIGGPAQGAFQAIRYRFQAIVAGQVAVIVVVGLE